jgi:glycosyltransferase involved in cell wall biosynthesis
MLAEFSALDSRIRVRLNEKNGGISAASMSAAEMAEGEFLLLLDHDDELHRHALAEVARQINLTPDAALIYSDEDKINEMGERSYPTFKPGFDPDMLLAYCYTGHILCVRADVFRAVGGLRSDFDGAQDWDLLIRITEAIGPSRIQHIPKPLYHWRMHPESTSMNLDSKPFSQAAWQRVLEDCLERRGLSAKVEKGLFLGSMRIRYSIPDGTRTAVILRMDDGSRQLAMAGRARMNEGIRFFESFFSTVHDLETQRIVLSTEDLDADIAVFINVPVDRLNHFFYEELISQCSRPGCGMAGGVLLDIHGRIVSSGLEASTGGAVLNAAEGMPLISLGYMGRLRVVHAAPAVSPHFFAVRASVLASAGGMARLNGDSGHGLSYALAAECRKMGLKVIFTPFAIATAAAAPESAPRWNEAFAVPSELALNSNLSAFPDVVGALRNGI